MRFSRTEIKELGKAWFFISLAFSVLFSGGLSGLLSLNFNFFLAFAVSGMTVGIAFLFHELMHKFMAQKYGYWAEFRAFDKMLWLALLFSLFGFIIAAPGGVIIRTRSISEHRRGKISLAGPLTNIFLALLFVLFYVFSFQNSSEIFNMFLGFGFKINSLLALFNLIPFPAFDGSKIIRWNRTIWAVVGFVALVLFILSFYII